MKPYEDMVTYESMMIGYTDALDRFDAAISGGDTIRVYNSLSEAINWASSLDLRIGHHWVPNGKPLREKWSERIGYGALVMSGVRFARNRVHHQWSDAIVAVKGTNGVTTWTWRPAAELPKGKNDTGMDTYVEQLEGRPVKVSLDALGGAFLTLMYMLEPYTIPRGNYDWPLVYDEEADGYYPSPSAVEGRV